MERTRHAGDLRAGLPHQGDRGIQQSPIRQQRAVHHDRSFARWSRNRTQAVTSMPGQLQLRHYLGYISLCLIWGSTWMAIRVVVKDVPPLWAAALRFVIAAVILLAIALIRRMPFPQTRREWRAVAVLSFTMMAFYYGLIFWA